METLEHIITQMGARNVGCLTDGCTGRYAVPVSPRPLPGDRGTSPGESQNARSRKIDKVLTGKIYGHSGLCGDHGAGIFSLTFGVIGAWLGYDGTGNRLVSQHCDRGLSAYGINPVVHSCRLTASLPVWAAY